jgi:Mg2+ and Co2+ transporter CorA
MRRGSSAPPPASAAPGLTLDLDLEARMNRWAIELKNDGKGHAVDAAEACAARRSPAIFVWVHLDGREKDTLEWLQAHGGMPTTVIYALTAVETRPRCEAIDDGALINLRGPRRREEGRRRGHARLDPRLG